MAERIAVPEGTCHSFCMPGSRVEWSSVEPYCALWGTIDDRVALYPWYDRAPSREVMDSQLLTAVLLGEPLLIIDAHLWMSDGPREALFDDNSVLRELLSAGFVRVISKNEGHLSALAEKMAPQIPSYAQLVHSQEWETYRRNLKAIEESGDYKWCPVPRINFSVGFIRLAEQLRERSFESTGLVSTSETEFQMFIDEFLTSTRSIAQGPRSLWETCALKLARPKTVELMQLANEMYHMNFATCLGGQFSKPIRVQTRNSTIFDWLTTERPDGHEDDEDSARDQAWAFRKIPQVNFDVPANTRWRPTGYQVRKILESIKGPKEDYRRNYEEYVRLIRTRQIPSDPVVWRAQIRRLLAPLETARDTYREKLIEQTRDARGLTSAQGRRFLKWTTDFGLPLGSVVTAVALGGSPVLVAAAFAVSTILAKSPTVLEQVRSRTFSKRGRTPYENRLLPAAISSRRIHADAAKAHVAGLPVYSA